VNTLVGGLLVVVPVYLAVLLLLKAMQSVAGLVRPLAKLLPPSIPAENFLSLLLVLSLCFLIGLAIRAPTGRAIRERIEKSLFERIPGYALIRSLTQRLAGEGGENVWQPALAEIEEALVPAFIIEELEDGHEIFSGTDIRYSSSVTLVIDPIDIGINSVLSLFELRDISLARAEYEVGREIVLRLPRAQQNIAEFLAAPKEETRGLDSSDSQATIAEDSVR
jgi:hypothetical protein